MGACNDMEKVRCYYMKANIRGYGVRVRGEDRSLSKKAATRASYRTKYQRPFEA